MKKILCVCLTLVMVLCLCSVNASAVATIGGFGDTDGDGEVSASDALCILQAVVGKREIKQEHRCFSDVNTDYKVDSADALQILRRVVGKINRFTADDDFYVNLESVNTVTVKRGGTAPLQLKVETKQGGEQLMAQFDTSLISLASNGGTGTIDLTVQAANLSQGTTTQVFFYVNGHASLYKMVQIVIQ